MSKFRVTHKAGLGLPGGAGVKGFGETVDLDDEAQENPAIAGWIKNGLLVDEASWAGEGESGEDVQALKDRIAELEGENETLTARVAKLEEAAANEEGEEPKGEDEDEDEDPPASARRGRRR